MRKTQYLTKVKKESSKIGQNNSGTIGCKTSSGVVTATDHSILNTKISIYLEI